MTQAQTGTIAGVVVDSEQGDPLIGATVAIVGTTQGAATDLEGRYRITNLDPGEYDVRFSYTGYQAKTVERVSVEAGETTRLEIDLTSETRELGEVTVTAQAARDSEAGLLRQRQKATGVSDAISAEAMSRSGASDAADAMEQVTGASVVDGKYVVVRGLGGRYASTQLNGVDLPSSDPSKNSVQFDLFPTDMLDNVTTLKTFTPDRPGNFSGGLVDINTKSFPNDLNFSFSSSVTINPQVHFDDSFLTHEGGNLDWLGFDDGTRSVPNVLDQSAPNEIPDQPAFVDSPSEAQRYDELSSNSFNGVMTPTTRLAPIDQSYSVSLGNQSDVGGRPLGYVLSLSYDRSSSFYENGETGRYELGGSFESLDELILLNDQKATESATLSGIANLTYMLTPDHEVGLNTLYTHTGESTTRLQEGRWTEIGSDDTLRNRTLLFKERDVLSLQLRGKSFFSQLGDAELEWSGSFSQTTQEEPDRRFFASLERSQSGERDPLFFAFDQGIRPPSRLFRDLEESKYTSSLDITVPFSFADRRSNVKVGGAFDFAERDFAERSFSYNEPESGSGVQFDGDGASYFTPNNRGIVSGNANDPVWGLTIDDQTGDFNSYDGERTVGAGYAMAELPVTERLKVIGGARLEATDLSVQATPDSVGGFQTTDLLPSLNAVYELKDDMNLRLAATRTLARPTFREIAPYPGFNFIQGEVIIGNPNLNRTLISNFDFRWEWFTRPGEVLAASIYYKLMDDPIERAFIGSSSNTGNQLTWRNVDEATVYGAEFEARFRLDMISEVLRNVSVGGNLSLTQSEIDVPCLEFEADGETCARGELVFRQVNNEPETRDLQGQSPYLLNLNLNYSNPESGTSIGATYNVFGERLSVVSTGSTPDVFEQPRPKLNLTASQQLLDHWTVKFKAKNLLDSAHEETYSFRGTENTYQRYNSGRSFSLGFTYKPF